MKRKSAYRETEGSRVAVAGLEGCLRFQPDCPPFMKATLKQLSLCLCGFPVLDESIKLGTKYEIDPTRTENFTFICGGCHTEHKVIGVWVERRGQSRAGYLSKIIFEAP